MQYGHSEFSAQAGDVVAVTLDKRADVLLLDSANYARFHSGAQCQYYGGQVVRSPARISVPYACYWHVVIIPPPGTTIQYSVSLLN